MHRDVQLTRPDVRRRRRSGGYTLIELLTCLSTLTVLFAMGAPSLGTLSAAFSLDSSSRTVAMALAQARVAAITRGRAIDISFSAHGYEMVDPALGEDGQIVSKGELPRHVTVTASGEASFSALGTVDAPLAVTLGAGGKTRIVRLGLSGEVVIE